MSCIGTAINLIQVTDCHLFGDPDEALLGIKTCASLSAVAASIDSNEPSIDALLITGDITQDNSLTSYRYCYNTLVRLTQKQIWLCGNHDSPRRLQKTPYASLFHKRMVLGNWQILVLNSQVDGEVYGEISASELQWLSQILSETQHLHTLVICHHHPFAVNSAWMDKIMIINGQTLLNTLSKFDHVRLLAHGHVHQDIDRTVNGLRVLATPSTCVQFSPESPDFQIDDQQPGYRRISLYPNGQIETMVRRLAENAFQPDMTQSGY